MNSAFKQCITCSKDITFKRSDAKYCSSRCRMQHRREKQKKELIQELFNTCSLLPDHTFKNDKDEFFIKSCKCIKGNQEFLSISDLLKLSNQKIEHCIAEKRREAGINTVIKGLSSIMNR